MIEPRLNNTAYKIKAALHNKKKQMKHHSHRFYKSSLLCAVAVSVRKIHERPINCAHLITVYMARGDMAS